MLGYTEKTWKVKLPCETCGRAIRAGAVRPRDCDDPPRHALCFECLNLLMDDPVEFERRQEERRAAAT